MKNQNGLKKEQKKNDYNIDIYILFQSVIIYLIL